MKNRARAFLFASIILSSSCSSGASRYPASESAARIQTALPSESDLFVDPPGGDVRDQGWAVLLDAAQARSAAVVDSVASVLQAPAGGTTHVKEAFNAAADGRVALATCKGHVPVIYYSSRDISKFDPRTSSFVRQHELAHHRLGQVDCSGPQPRFPGYDEKAADCAAVDALRPEGLKARDIVMSISSVFYYLDKPAITPYPSTRDRAAYLDAGCGHELPH